MEAKGLCKKHYMRTRRRSDGSFEDRRHATYGGTVLDRYEGMIDRSGGPGSCHPWRGAIERGYGLFWNGEQRPSGASKLVKAHAWGYRQHVGEVPNGHVIRHLCHNKSCQNPRHWATGTPGENFEDSVLAGLAGLREFAPRSPLGNAIRARRRSAVSSAPEALSA